MSNLTPAYEEALEEVSRTHGQKIAVVVQAVLEYKITLAIFERAVDNEPKLVALFADQVADSVATMCNLVGKSFRNDIIPLVEQVNKIAARNSARFIQ